MTDMALSATELKTLIYAGKSRNFATMTYGTTASSANNNRDDKTC